jgi:hypothetical protein
MPAAQVRRAALAVTCVAALAAVLVTLQRTGRLPFLRPRLAPSVRVIDAPKVSIAGRAIASSRLDDAWEVTLDAPPRERGVLVLVDGQRRAIAPPFALERSSPVAPSLRALLPLRAFPPQRDPVRAVVVLGPRACVEGATRDAFTGGVDVEAAASKRALPCGARVEAVSLGRPSIEATEEEAAGRADQLLTTGEAAQALALADRARAATNAAEAEHATAVAAEAAFALGRTALARAIADGALAAGDTLPPPLRARLLRTSIVAQVESGDEDYGARRDALRSLEAARPTPIERARDAALDLRLALDHDSLHTPAMLPGAARALLAALGGADDATVGAVGAMACGAAQAQIAAGTPEGPALLARASHATDTYGSLAARASCRIVAGDTARRAERLDEAEAAYRSAIDLLGDAPLPSEQREAWYSTSLASARRNDYAEAFARSRRAFAWVDFSLSLTTNLEEREALSRNGVTYYAAAVRFAALGGNPRDAVAAGEWGKGRAFGALLRSAGELQSLASGGFRVTGEIEPSTVGAELDAFARSLEPGEAALSYTLLGSHDGQSSMAIGVVTPEHVVVKLAPYDPTTLCLDTRALGVAVQAGDTGRAQTVGGHLYDVLVAPVASDLAGARRVFVSPHLCLHGVAWAALHDGTGFLAERMTFARVPPLLFASREPSDDAPLFDPRARKQWLVAHEAAHAGTEALPGLEPLVAAVAARVHPTVDLAAATLTPERFLDGAAHVDAVFFAGHARYEMANPLSSALLLSPSPVTDEDRVAASSVLGLAHRLDFVFLLGCETSRLWEKRLSYSDEAMGLQRAFLAGGARHVLGALWPILDRDAEDFVHALLAQSDTLDVLDAVGEAQRCLRAGRCPSRGISAWASFVVDAR